MDCSVTYESVKKATTKSTSNYTRDGYSSWIASRCNQTTQKATTVNNKYGSSKDGYSQWINERMERLKRADATNKSLISSLFNGIFNLNILPNTPKTNTAEQNEAVSVEFTKSGIYTQTPEGTEAVLKPIGEDYEVITTNDGEIVVKLPSGANAAVYNKNKNAIGSANNVYGSNGIDVKGKMVIDGKEVDVRVVAGDTNWGEVLTDFAGDIAGNVEDFAESATKGALRTGASVVNTGIAFNKGIAKSAEAAFDTAYIGYENMAAMSADAIGSIFRAIWLERGKKSG